MVHLPEFDAREAIRVAAEQRTAYVSVAPTMLGLMLRRGDWPNPALRLRRISYGSAPMPAPWVAEVSRQFECPEVVHGYGLTEIGGWAIVQDPTSSWWTRCPETSSANLISRVIRRRLEESG